jgi:hypothetical protein
MKDSKLNLFDLADWSCRIGKLMAEHDDEQ